MRLRSVKMGWDESAGGEWRGTVRGVTVTVTVTVRYSTILKLFTVHHGTLHECMYLKAASSSLLSSDFSYVMLAELISSLTPANASSVGDLR